MNNFFRTAGPGSPNDPVFAPAPQEIEQEDVSAIDLRQLLHVVIKRRWIILGATLAALIIGLIITLLMTPIYRASSTIQIDREAAQVVSVEGVLPAEDMYSAQEFYQTQYGLLRSRALAQRVVNELNLAADDRFIEENRRSAPPSAGGDAPRERSAADMTTRNRQAVDQVLANLRISPTTNSRLVTVSYDSPDARLATQVVGALTEGFIASNLERRYEASSYARDFLEERIEQLRGRLEETERELVDYAASNRIINVPTASGDEASGGGRSLVSSSLDQMNTALAAARTERIEAEARWRAANATQGLGLQEVLASPTIQALREQRATVAAQHQDLLQLFQPEYPAVQQLAAQLQELDRQIAAEARDVRQSLQRSYQAALAQEVALEAQIRNLEAEAIDLDQRSIRYNILQRELDTNRTLYDGLLQRYREIGIAGGVGTNNVSVVDRAEVPTEPVAPRPLLNLALAGALGLMLGGLVAFALEYLDESLRTPEDIRSKLGLTLLGSVPKLPSHDELRAAMADPRSGFSEAYSSIRSALQFTRRSGAPKSLLVTSSQPGEGKTTTSMALARAFARTGQSVLLIDGDVRDPSLHKAFGATNRVGLSTLLSNAGTLAEAVQPTDQERLTLLSSGPRPPSPADLLAGREIEQVLAEASAAYEMVIIDGPPVMGLADAPLIGRAAENVLFVCAASGVRRANATAAIRRIEASGGDIIGGVLEKFDARSASYGGYGYDYAYSYDYGLEPTKTARRKGRLMAGR